MGLKLTQLAAKPQLVKITIDDESIKEKYGEQPPRPEHWGGYQVNPQRIEFWQGRPSRLHDRINYRKVNNQWMIERLAP